MKRKSTDQLVKDSSIFHSFPTLNTEELVKEYLSGEDSNLEEKGFKIALGLFHQAAVRVPAYKDFLKKNKIDRNKIKTLSDFKKIPVVDKKNYLRAYSLEDLCFDGNFNNLSVFASSSGSSGEPFLWPRGKEQDLEGALNHELIFKYFFEVDKYKTLFINCFAMGTWIAGIFTVSCLNALSEKGYPILSVTPGLDKEVIFALFKKLADHFEQIIISGYPPYVKDIIDSGKYYDIDWKKYKIKYLFAAEGFSEGWRDYMHKAIGASDVFRTSINIYGSADAAILGNETPVTTVIRRLVVDYPQLTEELFGENRLPTLCQYDPRLKFFEELDGNIIFTAKSGIPLIRYSIGDSGGIYGFEEMQEKIKGMGHDLVHLFQVVRRENLLWKLPFVYIFGRADFTISLYGLLIYPEHIKFGLEVRSLAKFVTGKFVMSVEYNDEQDTYLLIRVELAQNAKPSEYLVKRIQNRIIEGLKKVNSEYNRLQEAIKDKAIPKIELIENGNIDYFKPGIKQKWARKN